MRWLCLLPLLAAPGLFACGHPEATERPILGESTAAAWEALSLPPGLLTQADGRDLIVLSIDTLRADRLPFYGGAHATAGDPDTPFSLAWLARHGTLWEQAWAPIGKTLPSLGSFWTGRSPLEHGGVDNHTAVQLPTRAAALRAQGWATHAVVANRALQPQAGLAPGFMSYQIRAKAREPELGATLLAAAAADLKVGRRLLLWAHFMAPHQPYEPAPQHAQAFTDATALAALDAELGPPGSNAMLEALHRHPERLDAATKETVRALYDAEVLTANGYLQAFLTALDAAYRDAGRGGLLDNAILLFFSDHGEELADHEGYFMHAKSLYSGTIHVPLLMVGGAWPQGQRIAAPIAMEDILGLVLDGQRPQRRVFISSWKERFFALRDGPWTLIHNPAADAQGPPEPPQDAAFRYPQVALFNRASDPTEQRDLAATEVARTRAMLDALRDWSLTLERLHPAELQVDPAVMNALGYAEGGLAPQAAVIPMAGEQWQP